MLRDNRGLVSEYPRFFVFFIMKNIEIVPPLPKAAGAQFSFLQK